MHYLLNNEMEWKITSRRSLYRYIYFWRPWVVPWIKLLEAMLTLIFPCSSPVMKHLSDLKGSMSTSSMLSWFRYLQNCLIISNSFALVAVSQFRLCLQPLAHPTPLTFLIFWHNIIILIHSQIVKHDWPAKWTSFIPDLVAADKTSETICENCMIILKVRILTWFCHQFSLETITLLPLSAPKRRGFWFLKRRNDSAED